MEKININTGGFREETTLDSFRFKIKGLFKKKEKPKPYFSQDLIKQYEFFRNNIYDPQRVFYPCCNLDISPIRGFSYSEIVLMDKEEGLAEIMKKEGIKQFIHKDVLEYMPENPFDLIIILNPQLSSRNLTKHLSRKGYILSNNYHNNASQLLEDSNFEGIGTIDRNKDKLYLAKGDFSRLEPNQFATYFYALRRKE